jgi:hypothetical protein
MSFCGFGILVNLIYGTAAIDYPEHAVGLGWLIVLLFEFALFNSFWHSIHLWLSCPTLPAGCA